MGFVILFVAFIPFIILWVISGRMYDRNNVQMLNGSVGSGKSSTALWLSVYKNYQKEMRKYKLQKFIFRKRHFVKPTIYSNVPLYNVPWKKFELKHLTREISLPPRSITYLNECTLIADSMLAYNIGKDEARMKANKDLQLFCKLIRHETLGGCNGVSLVLDTQNPNDLAMGGDRVLSQCNYIMDWKNIPLLPWRFVKVKTMLINMPSVMNSLNDNEDSGHWYLVNKKVFKMYDSTCYHFLSKDRINYDEEEFFIKAKNKRQLRKVRGAKFIIPTLTKYQEIINSNNKIMLELKKKGVEENGKTKQNN